MKKVLFLCTHNSARSQIAEGLMKQLFNDKYEVYSAGTEPSQINPYAVRVMKEIGIDISQHESKSVQKFLNDHFDYVITVCDRAKESCPVFYNANNVLHHDFIDPSSFTGTEEETLQKFREVRDQIKEYILDTFSNDNVS
jgi:arsenate reductase